MKKYIIPILPVIVYIIMQGIAGILLVPVNCIIDPNFKEIVLAGDNSALMSVMNPVLLGAFTIFAGILTVLVVSALKLINWKSLFNLHALKSNNVVLPLLAGLLGVVAVNCFAELLDLSNILEDVFESLVSTVWGILFVAVIGPIVEELLFREAVEGSMLRRGVNPWTAILLSAVLFGLIHGNPVQIFGAAFIGLILGIIYYKTGNIILSSILHICTNSLSVLFMNVYDKDATISSLLGANIYVILLGVLSTIASMLMFVHYWKTTPNIEFRE